MQSMRPEETRAFVAHNVFGVLSLADEGAAYAVPLYYGWDGKSFFFHVSPGKKLDLVETTREACLTVVRVVSLDDWASVQAFGKLDRVPSHHVEALHAMETLMSVPLPPRWGVSEHGEPMRAGEDAVTLRLVPRKMEGRFSSPAPRPLDEIALKGV